MKKHIPLALCAIVMLLLAASCEKEGVYSPEKRISKIYFDVGNGKQLEQEWTWKGKRLEAISFPRRAYELRFLYNGKQLTSITQVGVKNMYYRFRYNKNGQRLDSLDVYADNPDQNPNVLHYAHYDFSYNDEGLISGVEEVILNSGWFDEKALALVLQCAIPGLPEVTARQLFKTDTRNKGDKSVWYRCSISFTYSGENVTECLLLDDLYKKSYSFTYTDYRNHSYKLFQSANFASSGLYSRNLVKTCHYEEKVPSEPQEYYDYYQDTDYQYEIEDQYPVKTTRTQIFHPFAFPEVSDTATTDFYYEYVN